MADRLAPTQAGLQALGQITGQMNSPGSRFVKPFMAYELGKGLSDLRQINAENQKKKEQQLMKKEAFQILQYAEKLSERDPVAANKIIEIEAKKNKYLVPYSQVKFAAPTKNGVFTKVAGDKLFVGDKNQIANYLKNNPNADFKDIPIYSTIVKSDTPSKPDIKLVKVGDKDELYIDGQLKKSVPTRKRTATGGWDTIVVEEDGKRKMYQYNQGTKGEFLTNVPDDFPLGTQKVTSAGIRAGAQIGAAGIRAQGGIKQQEIRAGATIGAAKIGKQKAESVANISAAVKREEIAMRRAIGDEANKIKNKVADLTRKSAIERIAASKDIASNLNTMKENIAKWNIQSKEKIAKQIDSLKRYIDSQTTNRLGMGIVSTEKIKEDWNKLQKDMQEAKIKSTEKIEFSKLETKKVIENNRNELRREIVSEKILSEQSLADIDNEAKFKRMMTRLTNDNEEAVRKYTRDLGLIKAEGIVKNQTEETKSKRRVAEASEKARAEGKSLKKALRDDVVSIATKLGRIAKLDSFQQVLASLSDRQGAAQLFNGIESAEDKFEAKILHKALQSAVGDFKSEFPNDVLSEDVNDTTQNNTAPKTKQVRIKGEVVTVRRLPDGTYVAPDGTKVR